MFAPPAADAEPKSPENPYTFLTRGVLKNAAEREGAGFGGSATLAEPKAFEDELLSSYCSEPEQEVADLDDTGSIMECSFVHSSDDGVVTLDRLTAERMRQPGESQPNAHLLREKVL